MHLRELVPRKRTNPQAKDSDQDYFDDLTEIMWGSDPNNPESIPSINTVYLPMITK